LPGLNQSFRMLRLHPPHLEVHPDGIVDCEFAMVGVWVSIGLDTHVHPLQWDFVLVGNPFDHVYRTCCGARQKEFAGTDLVPARIISHEMMGAGVANGTA